MRTIEIESPEIAVVDRPSLRWVEKISHLMDSRFVIPGTRIRFGLDPLLSLIPGLGDLAGYIISSVLIYTMYNHGASQKLVVKMALNATLDALFGAIPIVGTIFDLFFKANDRNIQLLKEHYEEGKHQGSGKGILIITGLILLILLAGILFVLWKIIEAIANLL